MDVPSTRTLYSRLSVSLPARIPGGAGEHAGPHPTPRTVDSMTETPMDRLLDHCNDHRLPTPQWGRVRGKRSMWVRLNLPDGPIEYTADTLDAAAKHVLDAARVAGKPKVKLIRK